MGERLGQFVNELETGEGELNCFPSFLTGRKVGAMDRNGVGCGGNVYIYFWT